MGYHASTCPTCGGPAIFFSTNMSYSCGRCSEKKEGTTTTYTPSEPASEDGDYKSVPPKKTFTFTGTLSSAHSDSVLKAGDVNNGPQWITVEDFIEDFIDERNKFKQALETIASGVLPNGDHVEGAVYEFAKEVLGKK